MVKRILMFLAMGIVATGMAGCSASGHADTASAQAGSSQDFQSKLSEEQTVMCSIRVTAGDMVIDGVLYDNPTARGFAEMLPLTADLWHPAANFARAFNLPE